MNRKPEEKQLIENIKARIRWYQKEAAPEQIDIKELEALFQLWDKLEPNEESEVFDAEKSYAEFEERFLKEAEDKTPENEKSEPLSYKNGLHAAGKAVHTGRKILRNIGVAAVIIILLFAGLNIGTYATAKKGFFEFITQSSTGRSFFINGGEAMGENMGINITKKESYEDWNDLPEELLERICVPQYVPEGFVLQKLSYCVEDNTDIVQALYLDNSGEERIEIWIEEYEDAYAWKKEINDEVNMVNEERIANQESFIYQFGNEYRIYFYENKELYSVLGECHIDELKMIVENMQYVY